MMARGGTDMASPQVNMRWPAGLVSRVDAQAERRGMGRTEYVIEAVLGLLECDEKDPEPPKGAELRAPPTHAQGKPAAPRQEAAREAAKAAEVKTGVAVMPGSSIASRAMAAAGVEVYRGGKRPAYQRTGGGAKGKR
jgi:hypothetical protein